MCSIFFFFFLFFLPQVWCFEKRLGARQPLTDVLSEGDPVQFEAVAQDPGVEEQQQQQHHSAVGGGGGGGGGGGCGGGAPARATYHCPWVAHLVWQGRRPATADAEPVAVTAATAADAGRTTSPTSRRASLGSENSSSEAAGSDEVREGGADGVGGWTGGKSKTLFATYGDATSRV